MNHVKIRHGNFSSSKIVALTIGGKRDMTETELAKWKAENPKSRKTTTETTFGEKALSYIKEKNYERLLGRSIQNDSNARPLLYGKLAEDYVLKNILGPEWTIDAESGISSENTLTHPAIPFWVGTPDCKKEGKDGLTIGELKAPYTMLSWCRFAECKTMEEVRENHPDGETYYWQMISHAALTGARFGEFLVFCPYKWELAKIREWADNNWPGDPNKVAFINFSADNDLPWIEDGGTYNHLHTIRFEINPDHVKDLTERVLLAGTMLIERKETTNP